MTNLSWYKILFMTELLIAELLFFWRFDKRSHFPLRLMGAFIVCYSSAAFFPLFENVAYTWWYSSFMFFTLFVITLIVMMCVYRVRLVNAFFSVVAAYTAQHLAYEIFSCVFSLFNVSVGNSLYGQGTSILSAFGDMWMWAVIGYIDIYVMVYGMVYLLCAKRMMSNLNFRLQRGNFFFLSVLILLVDIVLNSFIVYASNENSQVYDMVVYVYSIFSCILVFYIQFNMVYVNDIENELEIIKGFLSKIATASGLRRTLIFRITWNFAVARSRKFFLNEEKCGIIEGKYGKITEKCVLYRGKDDVLGEVKYLNVERFLAHLG